MKTNGEIPFIVVEGKTLPETWEKAVLKTWEEGIEIQTEYDKPKDPKSKDCTMILVVHEPMAEPRIHRSFPGALEDLEIYRQEVIDGIHDHWIDGEAGKCPYSYHERLFEYKIDGKKINQIDYIIKKLSETQYTRRAQAITWNPKTDPLTDHAPCMQRIWFRMVESENNLFLNMNTHWRSRDAFKAAFMNIFAITDLQQLIAKKISLNLKRAVRVGKYMDISDSFHIYGSYFAEFAKFLELAKKRTFEQKTWESKFAEPIFEEVRKKWKKSGRRGERII